MPRTSTLFDPRTAIPWHHCFWADDPSWVQKPSIGQFVSTWRDGSGNGRDAQRVAGVNLPYMGTSIAANNRSVVYGDTDATSTRTLRTASYTQILPPKTVVVIGAFGQASSSSLETFNDGNQGGIGGAIFHQNYGAGMFIVGTGYVAAPASTYDTLPHLYVGYSSPKNVERHFIGIDGVYYYTTSGTTDNPQTRTQLFSASDSSTYPCRGYIAFNGMYAGDITTHAQWGNFKEWVRSYYGISVARGSV